jgi:hypothetical protein
VLKFRNGNDRQKTAILTYKAMQDATCNGKIQAALVWVTSMFVKPGSSWVSNFHQETPIL